MMAEDRVVSPLMLASFQTVSDEMVVVPPEIVPDTIRLLETVTADTESVPVK